MTTSPDFLGRRAELASLASLERGAVVCITGPGGAGKTRLAAEFARTRDAVVVPLAAVRTRKAVFSALATALRAPITDPSAVDALAHAVAPHTWLILDNVEQLETDALALLGELVEQRTFSTLVTSRRRLHGPFANSIELGPLRHDDAVELLCRRARLFSHVFDDVREDNPVVERICSRLEALPLVVELAAGSLRFLTVSELEAQLSTQLGRAESVRGPARLRTLRDSLAWSMGLLSDDGREACTLAAAFSGGFRLSQFERASGWSHRRARAALGELLDSHLAHHVADQEVRRMRLFESSRAHVAETDPDGSARAREQHARFMTAQAVERAADLRTPRENAAMRWFARERDNLRDAWTWLEEQRDGTLFELAVAVADAFGRLGPVDVIDDALGRTLELARVSNSAAMPALLVARARTRSLSHDDDTAWALIEELEGCGDEVDRTVKADGLLIAALLPRRGVTEPPSQQLDRIKRAERLAIEGDNEWLRLAAAGLSSFALIALGREDEAYQQIKGAVDACDAFPSPSLRARLLMQLARMENFRGAYSVALELAEEVEKAGAEAFEIAFELEGALARASVLAHRGEFDAGLSLFRDVRQRARRVAHATVVAVATQGAAGIHLQRGEFDDVLAETNFSLQSVESLFFRSNLLGFRLAAKGALGRVAPDDPRFEELRAVYHDIAVASPDQLVAMLRGFAAFGQMTDLAERREIVARSRAIATRSGNDVLSTVSRALVSFAEAGLSQGPELRVDTDFNWFELSGHDRAELSTRHVLRRLLARLVEHHASGETAGLAVDELVAAGWPDELIHPEAAASRVYTSIRYLRAMGLRDVLIRDEHGYLIEPTARLETVGSS